jgi:dipeptidyl aminopeptidase/acylaminoacyl peptidase
VTTIDWTADGKSIATVIVPENRGVAPTHGKNGVEDGPQVRITDSRALPQVIHASLLEDPHDKAQLKYYTTGQLALIDVKSKAVKKIGAPAMIQSLDASPEGKYVRVSIMTEPFSYIVPITNFGSVTQLWDDTGKSIATLATTPLREGGRTAGGDVGPAAARTVANAGADSVKRNFSWNPGGAGLVYLQAVGGAAPAGGRGARGGRGGASSAANAGTTRVVAWAAPFAASDTKVLYEGTSRLTSVAYSADGKTMFVADSGAVFAVPVADPSKKFNLGRGVTIPAAVPGFGGGRGGAANDSVPGGALVMKRAANGEQAVVVSNDSKSVFVTGSHAPGAKWMSQAPRPWVDKIDIETGARSHVFESAADSFDQFVATLDDDFNQFIITRESPKVITDAFRHDAKTGANTQLTHNKDASPEVTNAIHKRFAVTRPRDGLKFWVDATLPSNWNRGAHLPGLIWFYPREYTSQAEYDRSRYTTNINEFPVVAPARPASSTKLWVTQGYVLLEPDAPIVGDSGKMNDNYTRDLKEDLDAVIDAAVDSGFVDRDKMGVGGHSYGAFSTVNALTLTPYFKAGIAGDGMYNRSLTPFGFQSERRDFFQAQQVYLDMSPFYHADKIHGALLMYHALEDQNVGTAPISSIRMYHALQGLGKPAALYMYPYEDHSDGTYATDLDLWARWVAWFDTYVKGAGVTP